jgi:membrane protein
VDVLPQPHGSRGSRAPLWAVLLSLPLLALRTRVRETSAPVADPSTNRSSRRESAPQNERGRGRGADKPSDIPARGWKDILLRVYNNISRHHIIAIAAGVTFYTLLAIFPAIAALISVYGLFGDPSALAAQLDKVSDLLPGGAIDLIRDQMTRLASQGRGTLGFAFVASLAVSLWSANAGIKSVFEALNIVYAEDEKRGFLKLNALSLCLTVAGILFVLIAIAAIVVVPAALQFVGLGGATEMLI